MAELKLPTPFFRKGHSLLATEVIAKKRDGGVLNREEIGFMLDGMLDGTIANYQVSAWAMAILCRGMNAEETALLTESMLASGASLSRQGDQTRVDKHSTGGLGDKVSLCLAPLLACCGLTVPMLSGRGLGITGGTLDKLEAFPGFRCDLTESEIENQLEEIGCVITGTTPNIAPADRMLYGLRDVTATVPSNALITSSILSKKLAESLDALVLDVKFGSGCFMKSLAEAQELAQSLRGTARLLGLETRVILSNMNQPLGRMVGNACEVNEAIDMLRDQGPADLRELTLRLGSELLVQTSRANSLQHGMEVLTNHLRSGRALERFAQMIDWQGARFSQTLPLESPQPLQAEQAGWVSAVEGTKIGSAIIKMGGGRRKLGDKLNHQVGIELFVKIGDRVEAGQPLANLFCDSPSLLQEASQLVSSAILVSEKQAEPLQLIIE